MRPPISDAGFAVIAAAAKCFTPEALAKYVELKGWQYQSFESDNDRSVWVFFDRARPTAKTMIPLNRDYVDFERRFVEAISTVARVEEWNVVLELPEGLR